MKKYRKDFKVAAISSDEEYILCKNGGQVFRKDDLHLAYFNDVWDDEIIRGLKRSKVKYDSWLDEETDMEIIILEKDFKKVYRHFKPIIV